MYLGTYRCFLSFCDQLALRDEDPTPRSVNSGEHEGEELGGPLHKHSDLKGYKYYCCCSEGAHLELALRASLEQLQLPRRGDADYIAELQALLGGQQTVLVRKIDLT